MKFYLKELYIFDEIPLITTKPNVRKKTMFSKIH